MTLRRLPALFGTALLVFAFLAMFWAWIVGGLNCDETCYGGAWTSTENAAQWTVILALGIALFILATALTWASVTGRRLAAWCLAIAWSGSLVALGWLLSEAHGQGSNADDYRSLTILGSALALCTASAAATKRRAGGRED